MSLPKPDDAPWYNEIPLDLYAALEVLTERPQTTTPPLLLCVPAKGDTPLHYEIVEPWYSHGSSGGDRSGHYYWQLANEVAEMLLRERYVEMRRIPRLGYTEDRRSEFVATERGRYELARYHTEVRAKADALLVPGIHTDLTGRPEFRGFHREPYRAGRLFLQYQLPGRDEYCKVFPDTGEIVMPKEKEPAGA